MLVINELGDHQMETYFNSTDNSGGMMCEGQASMDDVFKTMEKHHEKSFENIGGKYVPRDEEEKTCAIRLAPAVFFKVFCWWCDMCTRKHWVCNMLAAGSCSIDGTRTDHIHICNVLGCLAHFHRVVWC